jgi:CubicO group peptidase (beta-lactamase class C family)
MDELAQHVRDRLTPHFPPAPQGASRPRARYSDTNFMLLCAVIEAAAGQPLHVLHQELLYRPLDLRRTWIDGHSRPLDPGLEPSTLWAGPRPIELRRLMRSFWGMYATAADTVKFLRAVVRGRVFDRRDTFQLMQARWNRFGLPLDRAALRSPPWPIEYGLGLMRFKPPRVLSPFFAVPELIGHTGSTGSWLFYSRERDVYLAGTVDQVTAGSVPFRFVPRLLHALDARRLARPPRA